MAASSQSNSSPSDRTATGTPVPLTFDEKLNQFWRQNRMAVLGLCALVLLAIIGKGLWDMVQTKKEQEIESAYAAAKTPDQLRAFAAAHPTHELAGVAELRVADEAYSNQKPADAAADYDKALATLKDGPLAARAKLGRALANVQAGKSSDGESQLKQIANDTNEFKAIRAEAAYQLASLAAEAQNATDAQKYIDQLNQIDPASPWARRAMALQASLPRPAAPLAPLAAPVAPKK
jgi:hypothetical protein